MNQVLQNLIQNAIKYCDETRWLCIRTELMHVKRGTCVKLVVEDKGIGVERKDLPHIFDPFYRGNGAMERQIHGTGLGLFFVLETLSSMGGNIRAESTPGQGSIFTIQFPVSTKPKTPSPSSESQGHSHHVV